MSGPDGCDSACVRSLPSTEDVGLAKGGVRASGKPLTVYMIRDLDKDKPRLTTSVGDDLKRAVVAVAKAIKDNVKNRPVQIQMIDLPEMKDAGSVRDDIVRFGAPAQHTCVAWEGGR